MRDLRKQRDVERKTSGESAKLEQLEHELRTYRSDRNAREQYRLRKSRRPMKVIREYRYVHTSLLLLLLLLLLLFPRCLLRKTNKSYIKRVLL